MEAVMAKMLLLSGVASGLTPAYHRHSKQYHPFQNSAYSPGAENAFSTSKDNTTACIMSEAEKKAMAVAMINKHQIGEQNHGDQLACGARNLPPDCAVPHHLLHQKRMDLRPRFLQDS
ncbi:hypothetical protein NDU88_003798 [Pleurodeles waltl]|uniref:Uncharacterized protein n=1 Tax=Pleurodeles waltl TaxID=8319 RepID=A0AAV7VIF1_PLEWA|nr:hypothetical protein NDU88_003798 [Pleurodeles waltl]